MSVPPPLSSSSSSGSSSPPILIASSAPPPWKRHQAALAAATSGAVVTAPSTSSFPFYASNSASSAFFAPPSNIDTSSAITDNRDTGQPTASSAAAPTPPSASTAQPAPAPAAPKQPNPAAVQVSSRQRGNPVLSFIRNVPWEFTSAANFFPDYAMGDTTCALFLSLKYHMMHSNYLHSRLSTIRSLYQCRLLLLMVDTDDSEHSINEITKICFVNSWTLLLCWSNEEAARYIELFKVYERRGHDSVSVGGTDGSSGSGGDKVSENKARIQEIFSIVRGVNKTDVATLATRFGSLTGIARASSEQLESLPGIGPKKVRRLLKAFNQPFITSMAITELRTNETKSATPVTNTATAKRSPSLSLFARSAPSPVREVSATAVDDDDDVIVVD